MGKKNFSELYRKIKSQLGQISCKISTYSDDFHPDKNYAGVIVYAINKQFKWVNEGGRAKGQRGKSFYLIILCTSDWHGDLLREAGKGRVHHYVIEKVLGLNYDQRKVCCGGFSYHEGRLKTSSVWLNALEQNGCKSDDSKFLSKPEEKLVKFCFDEYKKYGKNHVFLLPKHVDRQLSLIN